MKPLITAMLFLSSVNALALESGTYECKNGNEDSICPQRITANFEDNELIAIKVFYSGYCNDQGPYYYACTDDSCGDGQIEFTKIKKKSYHWENRSHGFYCEFQKIEDES